MPDLYIPPPGLAFRIQGYWSNKVLFSKEGRFGQVDSKDIYDDQWWTLVTDESHPGLFQIKSKYTEKVLYAKKDDVGHFTQHLDWPDQWFKIDPGEGEYRSYFRLWDNATDRVVVSRRGEDYPGDFGANDRKFSDQYFFFSFEDMEIIKVEYDVSKGKTTVNTPEVVIDKEPVVNDSSSEVTKHLTLGDTYETTSSFDYTSGFTLTIGTTATVGVPGVAEGKVQYTGSTTQEMKWGKQSKHTLEIKEEYEMKVPPHSTRKMSLTGTLSTLEVPCTVHSRSKKTGVEVVTHAIFHGVSYWNLHTHITD